MRRLTCGGRREDGAVGMIVALFMFFVVIGLGALTVDVGNINANRRVLQNGADAAVLSVARDCAEIACPALGDTALRDLVNMNAASGVTEVAKVSRVDGAVAVCGSDPNGGLNSCTSAASTSNLQECPAATVPPGAKGYVRVYTRTLDKLGNTILPYSFGAAIAGAGSGADQQTCAAAAWGPVGQYTGAVPITISLCMFDEMLAQTGGVANLPQAPDAVWPGYGSGHAANWPAVSVERIEYTTKYAGTCANSNGHAANGSFGWLTNNGCMTTVTTGQWVSGDPGDNMQCSEMYKYWGKTVVVPIFDCIRVSGSDPGAAPGPASPCAISPTGGGSNIWYHIAGWASFYLSGYRFPGAAGASTTPDVFSATKVSVRPPGAAPCASPDSCLSGWLTKGTLSGTIGGGGEGNYGVSAVQVLG